jgi:uncharacterized membrane protein YtjA (UPF0391 family)
MLQWSHETSMPQLWPIFVAEAMMAFNPIASGASFSARLLQILCFALLLIFFLASAPAP